MEAKGRPLRFLCDEQILEIPFFQRSYVWNEENWQELLDDLLTSKGSHFLGSIILKRSRVRTGEASKAIIIDGQQRLTTLSVLIKALYDCIEKKTSKLASDAREALFYTLRSSDTEYQISIKHSQYDNENFKQVMGRVVDENIVSDINLDSINKDSHLILQCYKFFYTELKKKESNIIVDLWDTLFDKYNNILVVIDLDEDDNEQKIFDTINSSGIRLTATDIIKNSLYQHLIELTGDRDSVSQYYRNTWEKMFEEDEDCINYWNKEITTGRFKRQHSELLLQAIAVIELPAPDQKDFTFDKLSEYYKKHISNLNENETKQFISTIIEYAAIYKKHILDFNGNEVFKYNNDDLEEVEKRVLLILDKTDISTFNPYIIYIFKTFKDDEKKIIERLLDLESFVMLHLTTKTTAKNFNKNCREFIKDTSGINIKKKIKDFKKEDVREGLSYKVPNNLGNIILFCIELHRLTDPRYNTRTLQYTYQLEHIMPQKWEKNWKSVDFVDEKGNVLPNNEDSANKRTKKVYSIGNMTLLSGRLNVSVSNSDFKTKMEGDSNKKGIEFYSSLSVTKDDLVENVYKKNKKWNEQTITEREAYLVEEVMSLWGSNIK